MTLAQAELDDLGAAGELGAKRLHDYADLLQEGLGRLHHLLVATYFQMEPSTDTAPEAVGLLKL
ncbi:MAG: hypothetical protein ACRDV9_10895 [Acidimicrobiia bacterium]